MTVPAAERKAGPSNGNGSTTEFPFEFKVFTTADIEVVYADVDGIETVLELDSDYSVSLNADQDATPGGTVTYPISGTALATGEKLSVAGALAYEQETDIPTGGNFNPTVLENALDKLSMQTQQLAEAISRAAKVPITNAADADTLTQAILVAANNIAGLEIVVANIDDIQTVADDLNEGTSEINTVATSIANVDAVGTNISNVNAVAANETNINAVKNNATNINAVAGNAANINAVNANKANIDTVAANETNIDAVAGNATNINAVAGNATNINAVNANKTNIDAVAANETSIDAVAGISANVTTVAGIAAAVSAVAADATDIGTVAANIADVGTVADNIAAVLDAPNQASAAAASAVSAASSAAAAATALDNFDDRYLGSKTSDPTVDNDGNALVTGALYFNSSTGKMRAYTGSGWIDASAASVATLAVFEYVATAGQTSFSGNDANGVSLTYTVGAVLVSLNGSWLRPGDHFTATDGAAIVLTSAAAANDELVIAAFGNFVVADTYSQAAADALLAAKMDKAGGTFTGDVTMDKAGTGATLLIRNTSDSNRGLIARTGTNKVQIGTNSGVYDLEWVIDGNAKGKIDTNFQRHSVIPSGSTMYPAFDCRAWVNFNGTGTVAIRGSGNISSITDNGAGDYTLNFTTAMPDGNYSMTGTVQYYLSPAHSGWQTVYNMLAPATGSCRIGTGSSSAGTDCNWVNIAVFR